MAKTIEIKDGKKSYKLGFNREIVRRMDREGFAPGESEHRVDDTFKLVAASFEMYQPDMSEDDIFELWGRLTDKEKLYEALMKMYLEPVNVLGDPDENAEGNLSWKVTE